MILRTLCRFLLAALFLLAGTKHVLDPNFFLPIMPPPIPFPVACIVVSGVAELLGGIGLLFPPGRVRIATGWGLLVLLVAVFPANVYMAAAHIQIHGWPAHAWEGWARLPLQPIFMALVAWVAGVWSGSCTKGAAMKFDTP